MKLNYKSLLVFIALLYPVSLSATEKPTYLDYDAVSLHFTEKTGLIHVEKGYKSGFIDKQGNKVIDTIYDSIGYFYEDDLTIAVKNDKYGVINKKGEVVVPFKYDKIVAVEDGYKALINDRWGGR